MGVNDAPTTRPAAPAAPALAAGMAPMRTAHGPAVTTADPIGGRVPGDQRVLPCAITQRAAMASRPAAIIRVSAHLPAPAGYR